jgi:hypothetical protein
MRSKAERHSEEAEKAVRDIRRATRRQYSAEEKVRIVIGGLRGACYPESMNERPLRQLESEDRAVAA